MEAGHGVLDLVSRVPPFEIFVDPCDGVACRESCAACSHQPGCAQKEDEAEGDQDGAEEDEDRSKNNEGDDRSYGQDASQGKQHDPTQGPRPVRSQLLD